MNKKGSALDILFIILAVFAIGFVFLLSTFMFYTVQEKLDAQNDISSVGKESMQDLRDRWGALWDNAFVFILIGVSIAVLIASFMLRDHPAFFMVSISLLFLFIVLSALFSNMYNSVSNVDEFTDYKSDFIKMDFIMNNLPLFIGVIGILILGVLYAKTV